MAGKKIQVTVSGIKPVASGDGWFAIDEPGVFSIDRDITATVWLVGGGCDGEKGDWTEETFTALGGMGGDGGYVYTTSDVKISKDVDCVVEIGLAGDKSGTTLEIGGTLFRCDQSGHTSTVGGHGSSITGNAAGTSFSNKNDPGNGQTGVATPYLVLGSSGGGAMACDGHAHRTMQGNGGTGAGKGGGHREEGTNAVYHGCGGGGGDGCGAVGVKKGNDGGNGMKGCIVVQYTVEGDPPTIVVQKHYKRVCNTRKTCNTDYYSNSSHTSCCGCGNGNSNKIGTVDYTDAIHIGKSR